MRVTRSLGDAHANVRGVPPEGSQKQRLIIQPGGPCSVMAAVPEQILRGRCFEHGLRANHGLQSFGCGLCPECAKRSEKPRPAAHGRGAEELRRWPWTCLCWI